MMSAIDAVCAQASRIIARLTDGVASGAFPSADARLPTPAMKAYVESLARQKGMALPAGYAESGAICRSFLDAHAPPKAAVPVSAPAARKPRAARPAKAGAAPRKPRAPARAVTKPRKAPENTTDETPLRIPFGNKEVAQQLGARYRDGAWYAPSGVKLSLFRERGWL